VCGNATVLIRFATICAKSTFNDVPVVVLAAAGIGLKRPVAHAANVELLVAYEEEFAPARAAGRAPGRSRCAPRGKCPG